MQAQTEIDEVIRELFGEDKEIDFERFREHNMSANSDTILCVIVHCS